MKQILIVAISFAVMSCSNSSSDSGNNSNQASAAGNSSLDGTWVYLNPSSTSTTIKGFAAVVSGNKISLISMYMFQQTSGYKTYFRRNEGTYIKDGDKLTITYTYQTCNPLSTEVVYAKINGDNATIGNEDKSLIYTMKKYEDSDPSSPINNTMIEDKGCTILSKLQKAKQGRSVANDDVGSIFNLKLLEK